MTSFLRYGLIAIATVCLFATNAYAQNTETIKWYQGYLPDLSTKSVASLNLKNVDSGVSHRDNLRLLLFDTFNGESLVLEDTGIVDLLNDPSSEKNSEGKSPVCEVVTSLAVSFYEPFKANPWEHRDAVWSSSQRLAELGSLEHNCADFSAVIKEASGVRAKLNANHGPDLITVADLVLAASVHTSNVSN